MARCAMLLSLAAVALADPLFDTLAAVPFQHGHVGLTTSNTTYSKMALQCYYLEVRGGGGGHLLAATS